MKPSTNNPNAKSCLRKNAPDKTDLHHTPFFLLGATPRDDRRRIVELAEEKSLQLDSEICTQARADLTNPRNRLAVEIAWLPGVAPNRAAVLIESLYGYIDSLKDDTSLPPLANANLLAAAFQLLDPEMDSQTWRDWILHFAYTVDQIAAVEVMRDINEERYLSGFPEVKALDLVEAEISERRTYYTKQIKSALNDLPSMKLVDVITQVVKTTAGSDKTYSPQIVDELVDHYESDTNRFLLAEGENIRKLVTATLETAPENARAVKPLVDRLVEVAHNWHRVAYPIQLSMKARGLTHELSNELGDEIRNLAIELFNRHDMIVQSRHLTVLLLEKWSDLPEFAEKLSEDCRILTGIDKQRNQMIEETKNRAEEWRREITYEAEVGILFKDKLRITPEGIDWKGRRWGLDSITRLRWGGTSHSVNGIPTGATYSIVFGDNSGYSSIELRRKEVYSEFIDRLWKSIGVRLLTEYLEGLRDGQKFRFGTALVNDWGMEIERKRIFSNNERVFCRWSSLVIWNGAGVFCVGKKDDKNLVASFSYLDENNIHVLEAAIRMLWQKGGEQLSSLLTNENESNINSTQDAGEDLYNRKIYHVDGSRACKILETKSGKSLVKYLDYSYGKEWVDNNRLH